MDDTVPGEGGSGGRRHLVEVGALEALLELGLDTYDPRVAVLVSKKTASLLAEMHIEVLTMKIMADLKRFEIVEGSIIDRLIKLAEQVPVGDVMAMHGKGDG